MLEITKKRKCECDAPARKTRFKGRKKFRDKFREFIHDIELLRRGSKNIVLFIGDGVILYMFVKTALEPFARLIS